MRQIYCALCAAFFVLSACTASLLPSYDAALVDGLDTANIEAQTLFSALSVSAAKTSFAKQEDKYNSVIGRFAALKTRANTRPQPSLGPALSERLKAIPSVAAACPETEGDGPVSDCLTLVTPRALSEIVETLSAMRDRHRAAGLGDRTLAFLIRDYEISIEQAMSIEAALK